MGGNTSPMLQAVSALANPATPGTSTQGCDPIKFLGPTRPLGCCSGYRNILLCVDLNKFVLTLPVLEGPSLNGIRPLVAVQPRG